MLCLTIPSNHLLLRIANDDNFIWEKRDVYDMKYIGSYLKLSKIARWTILKTNSCKKGSWSSSSNVRQPRLLIRYDNSYGDKKES